MDFEIEKTERFYLKTNEKNNTGDLKSDTLGTRGFFLRPDDTSLRRSRGSNKDLGNESQEAVDEIEDHEVDADARTEEVSYTTKAIHVKSHYLIAFLRASKVF